MSVLGVDLGTAGVRAVAFDAAGGVVTQASHAVTLSRSGTSLELVEQGPFEVIAAVESALRRAAIEATERGDEPEAMVFSVPERRCFRSETTVSHLP